MDKDPESQLTRRLRLASNLCIYVVLAFALVILLQRTLHWPLLTGFSIWTASPSAATAIEFFLSAIALRGLAVPRRQGLWFWLWRGCATFVAVTALFLLGRYVAQVPDAGAPFGPELGQIAPSTAMCFALLAGATLTADRGKGGVSAALNALGFFIVYLDLVSHVFAHGALDNVFFFAEMSTPTTLAFVILFLGLLLTRPHQGWAQYAFRRDRAGTTFRILAPAAIIVPLLLNSLASLAAGVYLFESAFIESALTAVFTVISLGVISYLSKWLSIGDAALRREIEERKRAETRMSGLLEAAPDAMIVVDKNGSIVQVSGRVRATFGYASEELLGKPISLLLPERYHEPHIVHVQQYMLNTEPRKMGAGLNLYGRRKDGSEFPVEISLSPDRSAEDMIVIAAVRDITDRRAIEAQLRQAQKMEAIGNLTGGIAHDFNNLLGVIIGNIDLLRERLTDDAVADQLAGEALSAALGGADLTQRLLAFARRQPLQPHLIQPNDLLADIVKLLSRTLGQTIEIELDLSPDVSMVVVDPTQLAAGITNLATNARDAMPEGGKLKIATANRHLDSDYAANHSEVNPGEYVMIEVCDNGTGISSDAIEQVFEPFFTTKAQGKGTGLGLSMVFGFVKQSGGHINLYSEVGVGTTFRIYLPRAETDAIAADVVVQPNPRANRGHETILAVEDNAGLRAVVVRQLTELGYRVFEADTGPAALAILEAEKMDLLFTDVIMPGGMNGYELGRAAITRWPDMKVLLTSGFPEEKINGNAAAPWNMRLLIKPYRKGELARMLRAVLDE